MDKTLNVHKKIDSIVEYITPLLPFVNCHMVEYITNDHWNKFIPKQIIEEVNQNGYYDTIDTFWKINNNLFESNDNNNNLFKHLYNYIITAKDHYLSNEDICLNLHEFKDKLSLDGVIFEDTFKIIEFMSGKKSHEVEILSAVLASLHKWSNSTHILDLGGGKGYLSSTLTLLYKIPVLNIDCSKINAKGAANRNIKLDRYWPTILKKAQELKLKDENCSVDNSPDKNKPHIKNDQLYRHIVEFITPNTDLAKMIGDSFQIEDNKNDAKFTLTGLHTCGSLGSTILKLFIENVNSSLLCVVPCCYNLMTENSDNELQCDFPMSKYLKGFHIGRNARMLAAQSLDRVVAYKQLPSISLYYRALFQVLIENKAINESSFKKLKDSNFEEYVQHAIKKCHLDINLIDCDSEYLKKIEDSYNSYKEHLTIFYLLRLCLAPVIEGLILLDKYMYLLENGFDGTLGEAYLVKMFDPILSPRCNSLIAIKR